MEFLDIRDATDAEKKEIERILATGCASVEFPFDPQAEDITINNIICKDDHSGLHSLENNSVNTIDDVKHELTVESNLVDGGTYLGHDGSNGPIAAISPFGGPFLANHLGTGVPSSAPYAALYSPKGGSLIQAENGEMLFYGPTYVSMANSTGPPPYAPIISNISTVPVVSQTMVDSSKSRPGQPCTSSSSSSNIVAVPNPVTAGITTLPPMAALDEANGNRVPVSAPSGAPYQMTIHPPPPPGPYLSAAAFRPHSGTFLPVPQHMYSSCFIPLPLTQYYHISHLPSNATSPSTAAVVAAATAMTNTTIENNQAVPSGGNMITNLTSPTPTASQESEVVECYQNKDPVVSDNENAQERVTSPNINSMEETAIAQRAEVVQLQSANQPQRILSQNDCNEDETCDTSDKSVKTGLTNSVVENSVDPHHGERVNSLGTSKLPAKDNNLKNNENCLNNNTDHIVGDNNVNNVPQERNVKKESRPNGSLKKDSNVDVINEVDNISVNKKHENKEVKGTKAFKEVKDNKKTTNNNFLTNHSTDSSTDSSTSSLSPSINNSLNQSSTSSSSGVYTSSSSSTRSWADLFKARNSNHNSSNYSNAFITSSSQICNATQISPRSFVNEVQSEDNVNQTINNSINIKKLHEASSGFKVFQEDALANKLGKRLKDIHLKHSLPYLMPRGFINRGNWCYINATLQALLYCPPFYNLMREIGEIPGLFRDKSSTPIIDSFAKFFSNFLPSEPMIKRAKSSDFNGQDIAKGESFEPKCIYDTLGQIKIECLKGKQEDAEEFLSSILNGLHDEMVSLFKYNEKTPNGESNPVTANGHGPEENNHDQKLNNDDNDSNLWNVVGPKHKILPTRSTKVNESPIMEIFGGSMISVRTAGTDKCGNRQPFFTLQLDIQSDKIRSVEDALKSLTMRESIHGYQCPKTKQTIDASYQTFLDQLPPILILHLKLFIYDKDGGSKKLVKKIDYPIDLELPRECLHMDRGSDKNKYSKSYKLLSVVYHDGNESVKGHYLTDLFHIGSSNWLRCDDNNVKTISVSQLLNPQPPRVPYLLFYRRCDTLRSSNSSQQQRGSNNSSSH